MKDLLSKKVGCFEWSFLKDSCIKGNYLKSNYLKGNCLKGNYLKGNCLKGNYLKGNPKKGNCPAGNNLEGNCLNFKENRSIIKIIAFFVVIIIAAAGFPPLEIRSAGSGADVVMEVKAGFDGTARLGCYIPYRILLINRGRTINGEVQVEVKIDTEHRSIISMPVSLPEGSTKEVVINAPVFSARRSGKIRLVEGNRTIKEIEYSFTRLVPPEMKMIGVLSSDNSAYSFLNGALIPFIVDVKLAEEMILKSALERAAGVYSTYSTVQMPGDMQYDMVKAESVLIPLDNQNLPEDINVMRGFDVLIISNFDTSTLSGRQLETIEKWVGEGGTLVIGTGHNWKKVYNSLPQSLKKFTVTGTTFINTLEELEEFAGGAKFDSDASLAVVSGNTGFEHEETGENGRSHVENRAEEGQAEGAVEGEQAEGYGAAEKAEGHGAAEQGERHGTAQQPRGNGTGKGEKVEKTDEQLKPSLDINEVLIGKGEQPIAVKYVHGSGRILFLAFDPGMEPVAGWKGKQAFWENLLFHSSINSASRNIYERGSGYYYSSYSGTYYNPLAEQVPENRRISFKFICIAIGVYIIIVGPFLYLFLKKKGKREMSWVAIPAVALLCTFVVYLFGFKTRYRTAVLNAVSTINLDMLKQKAEITTDMGVFNNKRGDMKLTYPEKEGIEFDITRLESSSYVVYADGREPEGKVVSKVLLSDPMSYELYDVSMWEPKHISARKTEDLESTIISSVNISDGRVKAVINNTTKYDLMEAFITLGLNFISIGDILSGQEKVIDVDLNSPDVYKSLEQYLDAKYGRTSYPTNAAVPEDFPEKYRKRRAVESLLGSYYYGLKGQAKIGLYALNYQDLGYDIEINGQEPVKYYTNGIFTSLDMSFEKGKEFDIPAGIIQPRLSQESVAKNVASIDGDYGVRVKGLGDIDFIYAIPENLYTEEFSLEFQTYVPVYVKYNIEALKERNSNFQVKILQNKYEYYIYNNSLGIWEQIGEHYVQAGNAGQYVDKDNCIRVRVKVLEIAMVEPTASYSYVEAERLAFPALQIKGVVK
ncbi:MAG: hypothetical protein GX754_07805 [Clostridiaceae bacterium]|nr:hypothetical protein [Clostridiaceae bacterium]